MRHVGNLPLGFRPKEVTWTGELGKDPYDPYVIVKVSPDGKVEIGGKTNPDYARLLVKEKYGVDWVTLHLPVEPPDPIPLTIHSVMCNECGGWEVPVWEKHSPHSAHLKCFSCGEILISVRTVEV